jgi:hypothetical protein
MQIMMTSHEPLRDKHARRQSACPESLASLGARLRRLADQAVAGGAAPEQIEEDITAIIHALLAVDDPRRQESLRLGLRMAAARGVGTSIGEIAAEFGRSRSQVHRLLAVARSHATLCEFNRRGPNRGTIQNHKQELSR